jgi:hypothetical protein
MRVSAVLDTAAAHNPPFLARPYPVWMRSRERGQIRLIALC